MNNQRFLFFTLLIAYMFAPTLYGWIALPEGTWLKPFLIWALIVVGAFLYQLNKKAE